VVILSDGGRLFSQQCRRECRFCSTVFRPHPGFADHEDLCDYNPINRPHIWGEAVAVWGGR